MKITEKDDQIILRDAPFASWISGALMSIFFAFGIYTIISGAIESPNYQFGLQGSWYGITANILWFIFVVAACIGGFVFFFLQILTPMMSAHIKPGAQTVDVVHRRMLFFSRQRRFYFSQIKSFILASRTEDNKSAHYIVLKLVNDDEIELQSDGNSTAASSSVIAKLNDTLKKHHPKNKGKTQRLKQRKAKRGMNEKQK